MVNWLVLQTQTIKHTAGIFHDQSTGHTNKSLNAWCASFMAHGPSTCREEGMELERMQLLALARRVTKEKKRSGADNRDTNS